MGYNLSWTLVSHATSYKLQYSIDGGDYIDLTTTTNNYYDLSGISAGGDYVLSVISQATGYTDSDRATIEYKPRAVSYTLTNCNASLQKTVTQYGATFPSFSISPASGYNFGTGATYSVYNGTTPVTLTVSDGIIAVPEFIVGGAVSVNVSAVSASVPYLTFSAPSSFTMAKNNYGENNGTVQYSTDKSTWSTFTTTAVTSAIQSNSKYEIYFRGTGNTYVKGSGDPDIGNHPYFVVTGSQVSCIGNIENLLDYATVSNDNHPTMALYCYWGMFYYCTSLTTAPSLPATTLTSSCYEYMFFGCTSLTTAPSLPATTLATECYSNMFFGCTSLTTVPLLPATTLVTYCYYQMFNGCTKIKLSTTQTGDYQTVYRIPTTGTGTSQTNSLYNVFANTGGTFTGSPTINITYYTSNTVV